MSFINQIKKTTARRQSEFFSPGQYLVEIKDLVEGTSRKGAGFIALETVVIDSNDTEAHPRGCERTWMQMTASDTAAKNVRGLLINILDISDDQLTDAMVDRAFQRDPSTGESVLAGVRMLVHARNVVTKRGSDFTLCDFRFADPEMSRLP